VGVKETGRIKQKTKKNLKKKKLQLCFYLFVTLL
jgi:hypothetical protein